MLQDLRYAIRTLLKHPGVTSVVVLTLALGIGANTAIFSVVNGVLLRPLPFAEPARLVGLRETLPAEPSIPLAYRTFAEWRDNNKVFEGVAAARSWSPNLESGDEPVRVSGARVSASYFDVMGVKPARGRAFLPEDDRPGAERVVILSQELWQRQFGADAGIVGRTLRLDGVSFNVVGVMPPAPADPDLGWAGLWIPLSLNDEKERLNPGRYLLANARLKPGVSVAQARADLEHITGLLKQNFPETHGGDYGVDIRPLDEFVVPKSLRLALYILMAAVACVLLIACVNVANLLLARVADREREMAVRVSLGATRGRIVRQLLTESGLMSLLGAGLGLLLAYLGLKQLLALNPESVPRLEEAGLNGWVLAFTLLSALVTGLLFGLAPALAATRPDLHAMLKEGGDRGGGQGLRSRRLRALLVISEVGLALLLLIASGLLLRSYARLRSIDPRLDLDNVLTAEVRLPAQSYRGRPQRVNFYRQAVERASSLRGVAAACAAQSLPLRGPIYTDPVLIEGQEPPPVGQEPYIRQNIITPDYFRVMGIPLLKGRYFTEQETWETGGVIVVNQAFARRFFGETEPLGQRVRLGRDKPPMEVVGVTADASQDRVENQTLPEMFLPYTNPSDDLPITTMSLALRTTVEPTTLAGGLRDVIRGLDTNLPVSNLTTMRAISDKATAEPRFNMLLISVFACVALALAAVGIYAVISHMVSQRTREIGIRVALGAGARDVVRLVVFQGMRLTLLGVALGLFGAFALTRVMARLLYGVSGTDALTYVAASALLTAIALLACYVPARRATRVDPMVALRHD